MRENLSCTRTETREKKVGKTLIHDSQLARKKVSQPFNSQKQHHGMKCTEILFIILSKRRHFKESTHLFQLICIRSSKQYACKRHQEGLCWCSFRWNKEANDVFCAFKDNGRFSCIMLMLMYLMNKSVFITMYDGELFMTLVDIILKISMTHKEN